MRKLLFGVLMMGLLAPTAAVAQLGGYSVEQAPKVSERDGEMLVDMAFNVGGVDLGPNEMLVLTPVMRSADKATEQQLPSVSILGRRKGRALSRAQRYEPERAPVSKEQTLALVRRDGSPSQSVPYSARVAAAPWMESAELVVREQLIGCAACKLNSSERQLLARLVEVPPFVPEYRASWLTPPAPKAGREVFELHLVYKLGKWAVEERLDGNAVEIERMDRWYAAVSANHGHSISRIDVVGFASPDGSEVVNWNLSEKRAKSAAAFMQSRYGVDKRLFRVDWKGADWTGLAEAVRKQGFDDAAEVLRIIESVDAKGREAELKKLSGGRTYKRLLDELYPDLRRNTVSIDVTVEPMDLERARTLLRDKPQELGLEGLYLLAGSLDKGGEEFGNVWLRAAEKFPESDTAAVNAAAVELDRGNLDRAQRLLERAKDLPAAANNMGVVMAKGGKYDEAEEYFGRAARAGFLEASHNLDQLKRVVQDAERKR